jgi:hypothetical protein
MDAILNIPVFGFPDVREVLEALSQLHANDQCMVSISMIPSIRGEPLFVSVSLDEMLAVQFCLICSRTISRGDPDLSTLVSWLPLNQWLTMFNMEDT